MNWLIDTLKRFTAYLESKKKPPVYALDSKVDAIHQAMSNLNTSFATIIHAQNEEIAKLRAEVEKLSLRIGLGRSIPTIARRP